ncbi:Fur family transcriptional regulator [Nitrospirillum sp. BR 11828]|uniref:Fur family transcriptional regulator n=1 Tax=Nitrospirillum sp. BR 11828 TaxID=3104325 RepID=UPI002ACAD5CD|nr:Fur family transcriptional regulator [Nitrospirillum sp. BR 11828]MDZ5646155.1 Fur family transcriptional regulator [Nitrospirillum sp. BR 11828]
MPVAPQSPSPHVHAGPHGASHAGPSHAHGGHDHKACVGDALARAHTLCEARGARLTTLRERVLELVWSSHRPRGAYAILEEMAVDGKRVAPLTVYRALDFLVEQGLVHRIESLNAYVGCPEPGQAHAGQFLVCERCGDATELNEPAVTNAITNGAAARGFRVLRQTVEVLGLCPTCQSAA